MFPIWVYVAVAAVIAATAFAIGQFVPGLGTPFVGLVSTLWVAYSVRRQQKFSQGG